jgi:hypothetical protein
MLGSLYHRSDELLFRYREIDTRDGPQSKVESDSLTSGGHLDQLRKQHRNLEEKINREQIKLVKEMWKHHEEDQEQICKACDESRAELEATAVAHSCLSQYDASRLIMAKGNLTKIVMETFGHNCRRIQEEGLPRPTRLQIRAALVGEGL